MHLRLHALLAVLLTAVFAACQDEKPLPKTAESLGATSPAPPSPPVFETFDLEPQLSLFPRIGDYRPEEGDKEALPFWRTFIDHLSRVSGVIETPLPLGRGRAFALRGIGDIDSVAFFSPLAVEPDALYRVSALVETELPKGASAGIGFLEFDEFLWIGEQYSRSVAEKHQVGATEGIRLNGRNGWRQVDFTFRAGPRTRMLHLVFFREGTEGRKPVLFDDIRVEKE